MSPKSMKAWRKAMGAHTGKLYSQQDAANDLGCGRRTIQDYENGAYPIPLHVALACTAIYHRLEPWPD